MEYFFVAVLTIAISFVILKIIKRNEKFFIGRAIYRQSDMHNLMKKFFSRNLFNKKIETQMGKRTERDSVKIVATDDKAYWVVDNVFYVADLINNRPDMSTAKPVDTSNMSKEDVDKMLFILDNLDRGDRNERGGTGN
jgi:hypothetical protein